MVLKKSTIGTRLGAIALTSIAGIATPAILEAGDKKPLLVPPINEITIVDPGVDQKGNPTVVLKKREGEPGIDLDIPPVLVVHKYYFTGKRVFQGPMMPGGPAIAVYHHPKTNEQMKVPFQLLPGAPKVHYTDETIEYDFGKRSIVIHTDEKKAVVEYRDGVLLSRRIGRAAEAACGATKELVRRTYIPEAAKAAAKTTKNVTLGAVDLANEVGKRAMTPVCNAVHMLPLASAVEGVGEDSAARKRNVEVQRAAAAVANKDATIPTNR